MNRSNHVFSTHIAKHDDLADPFHLELEKILTHLCPSILEPNFSLNQFLMKLPLMCSTPLEIPPYHVTFFLCCRFRSNAYRFFYDMITSWLIPQKKLNADLQLALDFSFHDVPNHLYIAGEVMITVETEKEHEKLLENLPSLKKEILLGVGSSYQAARILEVKGLSSDQKIAMLQENLSYLIKKRPQNFDYDLFYEMQHFLISSRPEFKRHRIIQHLSRIICIHYLFKKALALSHEALPDRRYISIKVFKTKLLKDNLPVIAVSIALILEEDELCDKKHVMSAIQSIAPKAKIISGSFFKHKDNSSVVVMYLELEQKEVTLEQFQELKLRLFNELKQHIENKKHSVFMPQNEEEIMRHILALSHQLSYIKDLPQVIITYKDQLRVSLEFLVVIVYVFNPKDAPLSVAFHNTEAHEEWVIDKSCTIGKLRKKYLKKALVCRIKLDKHPFLRKDRSIDLYKARTKVSSVLKQRIGEFRDYYGGMIAKEAETYHLLQGSVERSDHSSFLLENFFYHLHPVVAKTVYSPKILQSFFSHMLDVSEQGLPKEQKSCLHMFDSDEGRFLCIIAVNLDFKKKIDNVINSLSDEELDLVSSFLTFTEHPVFGLFCLREPFYLWDRVKIEIEKILYDWEESSLPLAVS